MKCNECQLNLNDFVDNELSKSEMTKIEKHISSCELCQHELNSLRQIKLHMKKLSAPLLSDEFENKLQQKIQQIDKPKRNYLLWATAATFATIAIGSALFKKDVIVHEHLQLVEEIQAVGKPSLSKDNFMRATRVKLHSDINCDCTDYAGLCI